jgi:putative membrane protein
MAISPRSRLDWYLENMLVIVAIPLLILNHRRCSLSRISYVALLIFSVLHTIGAHYTYSHVPLGREIGERLGFARNHFDRVVHFGFGLLASVPLLEIQSRVAKFKRWWGYLLPIAVIGAISAHYEILEWLVAVVVSPTAANEYLGTQGDQWDAQKDTLCALAGSVLAMVYAVIADRASGRRIHQDRCQVKRGGTPCPS